MLKKIFFALLLAFALATGIFAGVSGQSGNGLASVPAAHACPIQDPTCGG